MKRQMVLLMSNIISILKTKQLQTIYDDVIIVPERLQTDIELLLTSLSSLSIWNVGALSVGDLPHSIKDEKNEVCSM